jgi:hypothetical protein
MVLFCVPCGAQDPAVPVPRPDPPQVAQRGGEPQVRRLVSEDDAVRIDELRVRGITRRVVVQSKLPGAPAYEIGSNRDGRDTSQDRRNEGRSLWQLLSF